MTPADARQTMSEIARLMAAPSAAACAQVARMVEGSAPGTMPWPEVRVALLASFTIDPVAPYIAAYGAASGVMVRTYCAGGDQWPQEAVDPSSGLRSFQPDVIVVALELEDLADPLVHGFLELEPSVVQEHVDRAVARVRDLVEALRAWTSTKILVHGFSTPIEPSLGILDAQHDRGQTTAIRAIECGLREQTTSMRDLYVIDIARLIARVGYGRWHDARMWLHARIPYTAMAMPVLAQEYLRYVRAFTGRVRKVLVVDLDDTLWGGVVGEDGPAGIQLGVGYKGRAFVALQRVLRELTRRGVLLAVNSKNNPDDALDVIERHPSMVLRRADFAAVRINWQDKATNLVELSEELGLALDSFVYVDDNAAECERIRQALPEVLTVQLSGDVATYADTMKSLGVFDSLSFGEEDRERTAMYRHESERRDLRQSMGSLEEYYASLQTELDIEAIDTETIARAAELTQRTNQFNLTTRRFTQDELREFLARANNEGFVFRLRDRFGDHGIIGVALTQLQGTTMTIDTLLLSCRVLKRTVEDSVLAFLGDRAQSRGARALEGRYRPTRKNALAASLYETHGFEKAGELSDTQRFVRAVAERLAPSPWIISRVVEKQRG